jgi:hypothetical protein
MQEVIMTGERKPEPHLDVVERDIPET